MSKNAEKLKVMLGDWYDFLYDYFKDDRVITAVNIERKTKTVYPENNDILRAFSLTQYNDVKVVIIGLDPYFNGQADGLAFSCSKGQTPVSLNVIFDEIDRSLNTFPPVSNPDLTRWAKQGVLLINTALTVEHGKPKSHLKLWEGFMEKVIEALNKKEDIAWMLWGNEAKSFKNLINPSHLILESCHPAAQARGSATFRGNDHFKITFDKYQIDWETN